MIQRLMLPKRSLAWAGLADKGGEKRSLQWVVEQRLIKIMSPASRCRLLESGYKPPVVTLPVFRPLLFKLPVFRPPIYPPQGRTRQKEAVMEGKAGRMMPILRIG